jgi:hypothetical protein
LDIYQILSLYDNPPIRFFDVGLEHRLTSKQLSPASALLDHIIVDIDIIRRKQHNAIEQAASNNHSSYQFDKMSQFKHDLIHQSIITGRSMGESFVKIVRDKQQKYSFNRNDDESPSQKQVSAIKAIETRRLRMIKRAEYITKKTRNIF